MAKLANDTEFVDNMIVYDRSNNLINTKNYLIRDTYIQSPKGQIYKYINLSSTPFPKEECTPCAEKARLERERNK